ncbi:MAG: hypothetical protein ACJ8GN_08145 [Longimicrobiaceae bacterium]
MLLLALCGCGGGGAEQAAKDAASIAAGAELAADLRASGAVPRVYATQLTKHLRGELAKARQTLGGGEAGADAARLDGVLGEMHRAAEADERAGLRRAGEAADGLARRLSDAADRLKAREGGR